MAEGGLVMEVIELCCKQILWQLKKRMFTRYELEFIMKFCSEIVEVTKKKLDSIPSEVKE